MHDSITDEELRDRLSLIEDMFAEGRRGTQRFGWTFVLWGVVYIVAMTWTQWSQNPWAWPITTGAGVIATFVLASRMPRLHRQTTLDRAVISIWIALGTSMVLLFPALGFTGKLSDQHIFFATVCAFLGFANGASGLILRWRMQMLCAAVWWATSVATCFGTENQSSVVFLVAVFFCQIVFGIYGMVSESKARNLGV